MGTKVQVLIFPIFTLKFGLKTVASYPATFSRTEAGSLFSCLHQASTPSGHLLALINLFYARVREKIDSRLLTHSTYCE